MLVERRVTLPVVGIITQDGCLLDADEALKEATREGNVDGYPLTILAQMLSGYTNKNPSASQIAGGAWRRTVLENLLDFYVYPDYCVAQLRGTLFHAGLASVKLPWNTSVLSEKRYTFPLRTRKGATISGQIDVYYPQYHRLEDYKTCSEVPAVIKGEHLLQLAVYFWLLRWAGQTVESAVIDYISWNDMRQVALAEMPNNTVAPAVQHPFFQDEAAFTDEIDEGYGVLETGFKKCLVPSMRHCNRLWCRRCSVKWACDRIAVKGEVIVPGNYTQKGG